MESHDCIFCKIVAHQIPAHTVYEDERMLVFLDIHPIRPGHMLAIPKLHEPDFYKVPADIFAHMMLVVQELATKASTAFQPKKVGLLISGFDVPHTHIHIVPMHESDDITSNRLADVDRTDPTHETLAAMAKTLAV